jgi:D-amino peptidase
MKRVVMMTDLEGVAGVVSFETQSYADAKYNEEAKALLTGEINAAVEGLLAEDVEEILVIDGHGSGGVAFEALHPAAKLLHGRPSAPREVWSEVVETYDAAMLVGQHAMAGVPNGNLAHTQSSRHIDSITLNGVPIGETAQFALYAGGLGLPTIFLSGDDAACREAESLIPGMITVAVKQGLSRNSAISLSAVEARRLIREGVRRAVAAQRQEPLAPLVWEGPYVLEKRFFHTDTADRAAEAPDVARVDGQTVRMEGEDIVSLIFR